MRHTQNAFFREMQFWSHCYTVVSYQALFRLSVYKIPAVYLWGAKNVCFCTIRDFGSPTMYNKNDHLAKWSMFVRYVMSSFAYTTPFPPLDPRRPLHMLYICIATFNCPKGILGLGGKASKNKLKDASFIFSMTNVTI